jgi:hypothetical protein
MRIRSFLIVAGSLVIVGLLGFRILDLEQRVAMLSEQIGLPAPAVAANSGAAPVASKSTAVAGLEQRLAILEKQVASLAAQQHAAPKADLGESHLQDDKAILSVVEREASRVRDVQLEWHRSRWIEARNQQLALFAHQAQLTPDQTSGLQQALEHEADAMVDVLKRPSLLDDPDQVATDWQATLEETDHAAKQLLTPQQDAAWLAGRQFERRILWPWLPAK